MIYIIHWTNWTTRSAADFSCRLWMDKAENIVCNSIGVVLVKYWCSTCHIIILIFLFLSDLLIYDFLNMELKNLNRLHKYHFHISYMESKQQGDTKINSSSWCWLDGANESSRRGGTQWQQRVYIPYHQQFLVNLESKISMLSYHPYESLFDH